MHTYFLGLSLVGYDCLWGRMIRSGVAGQVGAVKQSGRFPNGDLLRTSFVGLSGLDQYLIPAVIFYNNILSNGSLADGRLLVSLFTTVQTTSHCMLVLGWDRGKRPRWAFWELLFWGVFNQAWGAAAVYPLYCFTHIQRFLISSESVEKESDGESELGPVDAEEALALISTAVLGAAMPAMLLYPVFNEHCSTHLRQGLIAFYLFTPLALSVAHPLFTWALKDGLGPQISKMKVTRPKTFVAASLAISGIAAAAGHAWALFNTGGDTIRRVFWPDKVIDAQSKTAIADGAREFLQLDIFVIAAALVPFADQVLTSSKLVRGWRKRSKWVRVGLDSYIVRMAALAITSCVVSPGALLAFSLAANVYF